MLRGGDKDLFEDVNECEENNEARRNSIFKSIFWSIYIPVVQQQICIQWPSDREAHKGGCLLHHEFAVDGMAFVHRLQCQMIMICHPPQLSNKTPLQYSTLHPTP